MEGLATKPPASSPAWLIESSLGCNLGNDAISPSICETNPDNASKFSGKTSSGSFMSQSEHASVIGQEEPETVSESLTRLMKFSYGAPSFATQSISLLIAVYAADFYVLLGARLAVLSFFTACARSLDVITDPVMAWLSDQTKLSFGRRRPYILIGAPFYALFLVLFFSPPTNMSETAIGVWFCTFYCLFFLSDTVANIPYEALGPELSKEHNERNSLFFTAKIFMFIGMLFGAIGPALVKIFLMGGLQGAATMIPCESLSLQDDGTMRLHYLQANAPAETCTLAEPCVSHTGASCQRIQEAVAMSGMGSHVYTFDLADVEVVCGISSREGSISEPVQCWGSTWSDACNSTLEDEISSNSTCVPSRMWKQDDAAAQRLSFTIVAATFGAYYVLSACGCVAIVKENVRPFIHKYQAPLVGAMMRTFRNPAFRILLIAWCLEGIGLSAIVSMFPFYVRYALISDGEKAAQESFSLDPTLCMGASVALLLIVATLSSPLWLLLAKRAGKYRAWMLFNFGNVITNALFFLPQEGHTLKLIIVTALNGLPIGGTFLVQSVLSDVIDYDEFLYGFRNEGIFSVYAALIPKFVAIPATAIPLGMVNMLGFVQPIDGVPQPQPTIVRKYIQGTFVIFPLLCYALGFAIKALWFPLKSKEMHDAIIDGVAVQQRSDEAVKDPITGQMISQMRLKDEEKELAYHLDNFGPQLLSKVVSTRSVAVIIAAMRRHICIGISFSVITAAITAVTCWMYLDDEVLSIIPVTTVIFFGFSLCFLVVAILRHRAALALRNSSTYQLITLAEKIRDHKISRSVLPSRTPSIMNMMAMTQTPPTDSLPL